MYHAFLSYPSLSFHAHSPRISLNTFRVFRNLNLSNLENVLQRNLTTGRECIFWESGGTNLKNGPSRRQLWWQLGGFDVRSAQKNSGYVTGYRFRNDQRTLELATTILSILSTKPVKKFYLLSVRFSHIILLWHIQKLSRIIKQSINTNIWEQELLN